MGIAVPRILIAGLLTVSATGCTPQSLVGGGNTLDGRAWQVVAYPMDDEVCLSDGHSTTCTSIREDRLIDSTSSRLEDGSAPWVFVGLARPEVATVRISAGDKTYDLVPVPLAFRSDVRAFAAAFGRDIQPYPLAIFDAQGNALEDPLLP